MAILDFVLGRGLKWGSTCNAAVASVRCLEDSCGQEGSELGPTNKSRSARSSASLGLVDARPLSPVYGA